MASGHEPMHVESLGLFAAIYLTILGTTYLLLPPLYSITAVPASAEAVGALLIGSGLMLGWTSIGTLSRIRRYTYSVAGVLLIVSAVDHTARFGIGQGLGLGTLGAVLMLRAWAPNLTRRMNVLGVTLGAWQIVTGVHGLSSAAAVPSLPPVGMSSQEVGLVFVVSGAAVVAVSVRATISHRARLIAHLTAGGALLAYMTVLMFSVAPELLLVSAAAWFRAAVLAVLPAWERHVGRANPNGLRARFGATFVTVALVVGVAGDLAVLYFARVDRGSADIDAAQVAAFWAVMIASLAAATTGVALANRMASALRSLVDSDAHVANFDATELSELARFVHDRSQSVRHLHEKLNQRDESLSEISHDLRNPLSVIATAGELLQREPANPDRVRRLGKAIMANARQMNGLVENLVASARLDAGHHVRRQLPVSLRDFVDGLRMHFEPSRDAERVEFEFSDSTVLSDGHALHRIVVNLVDNALKYSPHEAVVRVSTAVVAEHLRICVVDRGRGVAVADRDRIFERFYRAAGERALEGFGLGLYIARRLAEENGGRLWVEETRGGGATFILSVPLGVGATLGSATTSMALH